MSSDLVERYKRSFRLRFPDSEIETKYDFFRKHRGKISSVYAFAVLALLNLSFAFLEYWLLGFASDLPLYGFLLISLFAALNLCYSYFPQAGHQVDSRLLLTLLLSAGLILTIVYSQQYRIYYAIELILLLVWAGSTNAIRHQLAIMVNLLITCAFLALLYAHGASSLKTTSIAVLLVSASVLSGLISYLLERQRRSIFLMENDRQERESRQESWAYMLIDLDLALSGVVNFQDLVSRLKEYLKPVIEFESYILTSLEGQGPKPMADELEGTLFENENRTLWNKELLTKLAQTRHSSTSIEYKIEKGFFGRKIEKPRHYRLDIPIFLDANMMGVISLRRRGTPFDELDMTSSFSIAMQAMLIYRRSLKANMAEQEKLKSAVAMANPHADVNQVEAKEFSIVSSRSNKAAAQGVLSNSFVAMRTDAKPTEDDSRITPLSNSLIFDTKDHSNFEPKKTIKLLSRENADRISQDRYLTASLEGIPMSVLLIEVDGLSRLREASGDKIAYKVFTAVVKYLFLHADRGKDVLGRYGKNGVSVLLPNVDMHAAEKFAEATREAIEHMTIMTAIGGKQVSLSIGIAGFTDETGRYEAMMARADMALFMAKKSGRNCVKVRL